MGINILIKYVFAKVRSFILLKQVVSSRIISTVTAILNSLRPSDIYMSVIEASLVQVMACRLIGAKQLSEPMLEYC